MTRLGGGSEFDDLVREIEPMLRRALVAVYGADLGREATAEALAWAWEHRGRMTKTDNPTGYLFRVGSTHAKRHLGRARRIDLIPSIDLSNRLDRIDLTGPSPRPASPGAALELADLLAQMPERQRVAVLLVHGHGHTLAETADVLGCSVSSVRVHADRGLAKLRSIMRDVNLV
jgi:RNA polymerase sigma factor (sigma-70 family)